MQWIRHPTNINYLELCLYQVMVYWRGYFFFILFHIYLNLYKLVIFNTCVVSIHVHVVQLNPIHPASHEHIPSVCRHVLQLGEQTYEQCFPQYPFTQAEIQNRPSCNATLPWVSCFFFKGLTAHHLQNTNWSPKLRSATCY